MTGLNKNVELGSMDWFRFRELQCAGWKLQCPSWKIFVGVRCDRGWSELGWFLGMHFLWIERDLMVHITCAFQNMPNMVSDCDFLTRPLYILVLNRNVDARLLRENHGTILSLPVDDFSAKSISPCPQNKTS